MWLSILFYLLRDLKSHFYKTKCVSVVLIDNFYLSISSQNISSYFSSCYFIIFHYKVFCYSLVYCLAHIYGIQWSWVQIPLRPTFYSYFKESISGEYHMYQLIPLRSCDYLQKTSIKINVATDEDKQPKLNVTLNKRWNWSSCTKLTLSASWTHGLIAQSVRESERNSVVAGSNLTQANFL